MSNQILTNTYTIFARWLVLAVVFCAGCNDSPAPVDAPPQPAAGTDDDGQTDAKSDASTSATTDGTQLAATTAGDANGATEDPDEPAATDSHLAGATDGSSDSAESQGGYPKDKEPVDFIKRNGAIFTGWEKPKLAIVVSGMLDGYIEPCGCAGLDNQKGGLSRRHTMIRQLQEKEWPVISIDLGGMVRRLGPQASIKLQRSLDAHQTIGYDVVGIGERDLKLPTDNLLATLGQDKTSPFVSANVQSVFDEDFGLTHRYRVVERGGKRIGVTQVLGKERGANLQNVDFQFQPPAEALPAVLEKLKAEKCDLLILLANSSIEEARQLAAQFGDFDFVVAAGDSDPPSPEMDPIEGTETKLLELSHKGMYAGVLGIYDDPKQPLRYQRVPMDGRFPDSEEMVAMMAAYQEQLKGQGLPGLGLRPNPHPTGRRFVGSESCAECHTDEYDIWKKTPHAHATETLVKLTTPRQFDPECLSCHVTGWEPQQIYPFVSGFESIAKSAHLLGNGCENCHGPGADHVAAENGDVDADDDRLEELRTQVRLTLEDARKQDCYRCHDLDNSPEFDFETYWPKMEH
jgi:hypothetical protein